MLSIRVKIIIFSVGLCLFSAHCTKPSPSEAADNRAALIRDVQFIMMSNVPDASKNAHLQTILKNNNMTLEDYRKLYFRMLNDPPQKNLQLLKDIEKLLSADMKTGADLLRKKADVKRFQQ